MSKKSRQFCFCYQGVDKTKERLMKSTIVFHSAAQVKF